jgi:hypothetical protein
MRKLLGRLGSGLTGRKGGRGSGEVDENVEVFYGLVRWLVEAFERVGLEYVFTGALAASFYGLPRTTSDVDVVVVVSGEDSKRRLVLGLKGAGVLVDERRVDVALRSDYRVATFEDGETPYKVDVIFSDGRLEKRTGMIGGVVANFQVPEDLVLAKLRMIRATVPRERALKDVEDVRAILNFTAVDVGLVKRRAKKEGTLAVFEEIVAESG